MTLGKLPVTAAEIPASWIDTVREIIQRDGYAVRASAFEPTIEIRSLRDNRWRNLLLFSSVTHFVSVTRCCRRSLPAMLPRIEIEVGGTASYKEKGRETFPLRFRINGHLFHFNGTAAEIFALERDLSELAAMLKTAREWGATISIRRPR